MTQARHMDNQDSFWQLILHGVKNIQTAGYNSEGTVSVFNQGQNFAFV